MLRRKETALTEGSRKRSKTILDSRAPRTFYRSRTALLSAMPSLLKIDRGGTPYVFHRLPSKAHSATPSTRFVDRPPIIAAVKVAAPHREAAWPAKSFRGCGLHRPPFSPGHMYFTRPPMRRLRPKTSVAGGSQRDARLRNGDVDLFAEHKTSTSLGSRRRRKAHAGRAIGQRPSD